MTKTREYHRILLSELAHWEDRGWTPAVTEDGAVGADHWCAGTLATCLVMREVKQGCQGVCETCDCGGDE